MELKDLYRIYNSNIKIDKNPMKENFNPIRVGDILVAIYKNREIRGEVSSVFEDYFLLKGKNNSTLKITLNEVTEHYPKNRSFENKTNFKKNEEDEEGIVIDGRQRKKIVQNDNDNDIIKNSPDNQVDLSIENVKTIGKLIYYKDVKYSQIMKMFEKQILNKNKYWYLLSENNSNEIHVVRNNENAFQIQPFINALVDHFLKSQDKLIKESFGKIKISGNDDFSIISNIPNNIKKDLLSNIISLLSGIKK